MRNLIDMILEVVYVADIKTYELLYLNEAGKNKVGVCEFEGRKCYEVLQGLSAPCPFCTNHLLTEENFYIWEHQNAWLDEYYLLKDKRICWEGREARMEIALDITKQIRQSVALRNLLQIETFVMSCIRELERMQDMEEKIQSVLGRLGSFLKAARVYIFTIRGEYMDNTYEWCAPDVRSEKNNLQNLDVRLIERWRKFFAQQQCIIIEDIEALKETCREEYDILHAQDIQRLVAVPLELEGRLIGYIGADNPGMKDISEISPIFNALGYFIVSTMQRIKTKERLERLSYVDSLTNLYNRNRFITDLQNATIKMRWIGVVFTDVNGMKVANDTFGHQRGDKLLLETASKLRQIFGQYRIYRVGGDEFVVFCEEIEKVKFMEMVQDLKNLFSQDTLCKNAVGGVWEAESQDLQGLIARADQAMYDDKKRFYYEHPITRRYRYYNDDILGLATSDVLKKKLAAGCFLVYLQPKYSFADRAMVGAEALVRYRREDGVVVAPDYFIPLLERIKLIHLLDFYMFEFVCKKLAKWKNSKMQMYPVAVNFSRCTIEREEFQPHLEEIWRRYDLDRGLLEIEITERTDALEDPRILARLRDLKNAGFLLSIDDFGVQQANLSLFIALDFDVLKLDKSLLKDLRRGSKSYLIIQSLVDLCRRVQIKVVAEGVETEESFALLCELGCDVAQGYLFSRPIPLEDYEKMLHCI